MHKEYTAEFLIGAKLMGTFRASLAAAQSRLRGLGRVARFVGSTIKSALVGALAGFGTFLAANIFQKIFSGAIDEAMQAEQRTRALGNALMLNNAIRKKGTAYMQEQLKLIYLHDQKLEEQGVLHKDILDTMAVQLAMHGGLPPAAIQDSIDVMQNLLVATKGVAATEEDGAELAKAWSAAVARGRLMGLAKTAQLTKEQQKQFAKLTTVQARQLWLIKNIGKQYQGVNAAARDTPTGRIILFRNTMKTLSQEIGDILIPAMSEVAETWTDFLKDPVVRDMLLRSTHALANAIIKISGLIRDDLIPMLDMLSKSEVFQNLVKDAAKLYSWTKKWFDLMGLAAKIEKESEPGAMATRAAAAAAFPGLPAPYKPAEHISEMEKALAPFGKITGLEMFKPVVDEVKAVPGDSAAAAKALSDMKDAAQLVGIAASVASPDLINAAESATRVADSIANVDDWFTRLDRTLSEFAGSIPLIGGYIRGATPNTKPITPPTPGFVPTYQHGGIFTRPSIGMIGEAGPEAVIPLRGRGLGTSVHFAPTITINGGATPGTAETIKATLRDVARDFVAEFKRAQSHERRLSYEGGYG